MSLEKALADLERKGFLDRVMELEASTATAAQAAEALGVEPGRIAKTMSFLQEDKAVLILTEGTARIDNHKYKETFHVKAKMIPFDEVEAPNWARAGRRVPLRHSGRRGRLPGRKPSEIRHGLSRRRQRSQRRPPDHSRIGEGSGGNGLGRCV